MSIPLNVSSINSKDEQIKISKIDDEILFSDFSIKKENSFSVLESIEEKDITYLNNPQEPTLPVHIKTYTFPIGTKIKDVSLDISSITEEKISYEIKPASIPKPLKPMYYTSSDNEITKKNSIYKSSELFPDNWFDYDISVGRDGGKRVIFLNVNSYPVRYSPKLNTIYRISNANIGITYEENQLQSKQDEIFDLVIISPNKFKLPLNKLKEHKESYGIKTKIKTTNEIYEEFDGRDQAEQIKHFIKYALDEWNITYVLLVGGRDHQKAGWNLPTRYSNTDDGNSWKDKYVTDLYFADVYRYNETSERLEFDDWDSNGNDIFAEWTIDNRDHLDLFPDVYVGRLACRNLFEVYSVVNKIILYENSAYGSDWFKKATMVGGDTFPPEYSRKVLWDTSKHPDGEYIISVQSFTEGKSSEIKSVKVFVKNNFLNKEDDSLEVDLKNNIVKNIESDTSSEIYLEIIKPKDSQILSNIANITYITNDRVPPRENILVNITIKNSEGKIVFEENRDIWDYYFEGEITCDLAASYLEPIGFDIEKIYASNEKLKDVSDVNSEIEKGSGFIFFTGHSTPLEWCTHPVFSKNQWIDLYYYQMQFLNNKEKLPICIVDGCHPSQFDVSMSNIIEGIREYGLDYFKWIKEIDNFLKWAWAPNSWGWNLVKQRNGGFIASIGNTGLGYGTDGISCVESLGAYLSTQFFNIYREQSYLGNKNLGDIHAKTLNKYIVTQGVDSDSTDRKIVEEWVLLGDPSLMIGGYDQSMV